MKPQHAAHLGEHLRQRLFFYASSAIALGWVLGANFPEVAQAHAHELGYVMNALVFLMIYPMMVGLNLTQLPKALKKPRPLLLTLFYNFVITPLLSWVLVQAMNAPPELALGFYLVMLIPGASMAIAFTGMAGGSIEVATLAQAAGFLVVPFALPFFMHWVGQSQAVAVPLGSLVTTIVLVLILPMVLGDLTRRWLVRRFGPPVMKTIKPYLGVIPALTMLLVMTLIFFSKGDMLTHNWTMLLPLMAATLAFLIAILALMTWLNRRMGLSFEEHMAVAFVCSGKNNATAIAIALSTAGFGPLVAVPAATLPMFQAVLLVGYVHLAERIRRYYAPAA
ncbi:MAG: bile acid:sodium symporter [Comamonadaceae bacterium CG_4_9_14_3_um_filter_60_33]|nr:MAG: bile acid:sodium symporter [Comamonadaceae bacterium CG_4_10_14_3_um_filter_60_42]PJB46622.1 MAG: bile acid:sodium symporter [Comamonadaceae bacterium CG_4_9_14_3_um_filter_60_33]